MHAVLAYKRILFLWHILVKQMGSVDKVITVHGILEAVKTRVLVLFILDLLEQLLSLSMNIIYWGL